MYRYSKKIFFVLFLTIMNFSFAAKNNDVKVYDKGLDGGMRIYSIVCPNDRKTTVTQILNKSVENQGVQELTTGITSRAKNASSRKLNTKNVKKKALKLIVQHNRADMCLYPLNSDKECKSYKDVDTAAKAACELIR